MNLTTPPFDDVHVRKAMNLVMDLEGIQRAWGGPVHGQHRRPTSLPETRCCAIPDYFPYQQPPQAGDVEAAKAEMAQSKYDTDKDGTCDAGPCKGVINLNRNFAPWSTMSPIIQQSAAQDRHHHRDPRGLAHGGQQHLEHDGPQDPLQLGQRLGQGLRRPVTFFVILFDGRNDHPGRQHRLLARRA